MVTLFFFIPLFLFPLSLSSQTTIQVEYDDSLDIITLYGKTYIPTHLHSTSFIEEPSKEDLCEETLVTGPAVWFFIFMVLCKLPINTI